jgi:hypothetical protein
MIAVLQFRPTVDLVSFQSDAQAALTVLAARPGFLRGTVGRSVDDESAWVLITEWESVGAYRRGLGGFEVKTVATPLMAQALDQPSAFEELVSMSSDGVPIVRNSDRANDADQTSRPTNL